HAERRPVMTPARRQSQSIWQRVSRALEGAPEAHWLSQLAYHGARVALLLATGVVVFLLFPAPRVSDTAVLERGVVAPQDVIAEFSFDIPKTPEELLREQVEAASGVPPVYDLVPTARDSVLRNVDAFFDAVDSVIAAALAGRESQAVRALAERTRLTPTPGSV